MRARGSVRPHICIGLLAAASASVWGLDASEIKPRPGLILTSTVFSNVHGGGQSFGYLDTEDHFKLLGVDPDGLHYEIRMSAPGNAQLNAIAEKLHWPRHVRHEDLEESARMTLLYASTDPENYAGQTFAETSRKTLNALKAGSEVAFVFGAYSALKSEHDPLAMLTQSGVSSNAAAAHAVPASTGAPLLPDPGMLMGMALGSARHYYRGTLHRVEPQDVPVAVLVNGVRVSLPAVHATGTFTFGQEDSIKIEVWWLDNPDWPVTLHWTAANGSDVVTRIDWQTGDEALAAQLQGQLQSKSCRAELHGVYFNSGSAVLLDESAPMLKQIAALINRSTDPHLTIEGHTDNIGSAQYNQTLSEQRAEAVRTALVEHYGVAAHRLSAKGFGLTRPIESNATVEGRARNRRVELARACAQQ